jgi:translation initiation factor IF-3
LGGQLKKKYTVNDRIKAKQVRLIDESGHQFGVINIEEARKVSADKGLDLVLISETSDPPVCKLVNYGQFMYHQKKKEKQSKKSSQVTKELKMSPKISEHDYQVRVNHGLKFLGKRYKLKLTIFFRGREIMHSELGYDLANRYIDAIKEIGTAESAPARTGRSLTVMISPK